MTEESGRRQSSLYGAITGQDAVDTKVERLSGALRGVELFSNFGERSLRELAQLAQERQVGPETVLMQEGGEGNSLMVFMRGSARVERAGSVVARIPEGSYVGEMALLDGKPRAATVITDGDADLILLSKPLFDHFIESEPALRNAIIMELVERVRRVLPGPMD